MLGPVVETRTYADVRDARDGEIMRLERVYVDEPKGLTRGGLQLAALVCKSRIGVLGVPAWWLLVGKLSLVPCRRREVVS